MTTVSRRFFYLCVALLLLFFTGCISECAIEKTSESIAATSVSSVSQRMTNRDQVITRLRDGLRERSAAISVTFTDEHDVTGELDHLVLDLMDDALAETENPAEGDYIRYQYGGYRYSFSCEKESAGEENQGETYHYAIRIVPTYYSYLTWEEQVDSYVAAYLESCSFRSDTPAIEKIKTIYHDLCANVTYDKVHAKNPYATVCHTAYAAFFRHTATCQGYCTALYRLLREAGVSCRIVTGEAAEESLHAWVIAEADDKWYLLDPTWDAKSQGGYRFFMIGTDEDAGRHIPGKAFREEAFQTAHPMSDTSCP